MILSAIVFEISFLLYSGVIGAFSKEVAAGVSALGWNWQPSFVVLILVYFYSHYFFASNIAHVSAMYSAFLAVAIATGAPPMFAALVFAFFSNIQVRESFHWTSLFLHSKACLGVVIG